MAESVPENVTRPQTRILRILDPNSLSCKISNKNADNSVFRKTFPIKPAFLVSKNSFKTAFSLLDARIRDERIFQNNKYLRIRFPFESENR